MSVLIDINEVLKKRTREELATSLLGVRANNKYMISEEFHKLLMLYMHKHGYCKYPRGVVERNMVVVEQRGLSELMQPIRLYDMRKMENDDRKKFSNIGESLDTNNYNARQELMIKEADMYRKMYNQRITDRFMEMAEKKKVKGKITNLEVICSEYSIGDDTSYIGIDQLDKTREFIQSYNCKGLSMINLSMQVMTDETDPYKHVVMLIISLYVNLGNMKNGRREKDSALQLVVFGDKEVSEILSMNLDDYLISINLRTYLEELLHADRMYCRVIGAGYNKEVYLNSFHFE